MVRPLNAFCCGCGLELGAQIVMAIYLFVSLYVIWTSFMVIVFRQPAFGNINHGQQCFVAGCCLMGLPFIAAGFWGVQMKLEAGVRMFLYYAGFITILDIISFIGALFVDPCTAMPGSAQNHGDAMLCGMVRICYTSLSVMLMGVQLYFLFTIWSMCMELKASVGMRAMDALLIDKEGSKQRAGKGDSYGAAVDAAINLTDSGNVPRGAAEKPGGHFTRSAPTAIPSYGEFQDRMIKGAPDYMAKHGP